MRFTRRQFGTLVGGVLAAPALAAAAGQTGPVSPNSGPILDIADWSYFWFGVERAMLARGTVVNGAQVYVEHWIPASVRHPFPVVLIHGGYGQGTDWISTPDGRRGWASQFLEQGYRVYVVDRPGQGRNPHQPFVHGLYDAQAPTFENVARAIGGAAAGTTAAHTQWPGTGQADDPAIAQVVASLDQPMGNNAITQNLWRSRGALLLDEIGPSILMTHGDGSVFAWVTAQDRPSLVKGIVAVEQDAQAAQSLQGLAATTPALLAKLSSVPIAIVTADASSSNATDPGAADALRQAGCTVEHIRLADRGIRGNGPMVMMEKNNRDALRPILDWMQASVEAGAGKAAGGSPSMITSGVDPNRNRESTALKLADQGGFWVGVGRKQMPYGTIAQGQMFVQYMIPAEKRYPYPIIMVHGGGAQGTHMMGLGRRPGWVHYFVQAGYSVYWLDRPSYGRSPYHPDALGPSHLPNVPPFEALIEATNVFKTGQWPGPGGMDDPFIAQFMACESGNTADEASTAISCGAAAWSLSIASVRALCTVTRLAVSSDGAWPTDAPRW
jgi:pimeloyl-ACP methyl ester carboxylesterase